MTTLELTNLPTPVLLVWGLPEGFCVWEDGGTYMIMPPTEFIGNEILFTHPIATISKKGVQLIGWLSNLTEDAVLDIIGGKFCDHCSLEKKGVYGVNGGFVAGCEGSRCEDTKDAIYDRLHSAIEAESVSIGDYDKVLIFKKIL